MLVFEYLADGSAQCDHHAACAEAIPPVSLFAGQRIPANAIGLFVVFTSCAGSCTGKVAPLGLGCYTGR
jgi:hypothetical protein